MDPKSLPDLFDLVTAWIKEQGFVGVNTNRENPRVCTINYGGVVTGWIESDTVELRSWDSIEHKVLLLHAGDPEFFDLLEEGLNVCIHDLNRSCGQPHQN